MTNASVDRAKEVVEFADKYGIESAVNKFGITKTTIWSYRKKLRHSGLYNKDNRVKEEKEVTPAPEKAAEQISTDISQHSAIITTKSLNIQTVEQAIKAANIDLNVWQVDRHVINSWEMTTKLRKYVEDKNGNMVRVNDQPETFTNFQVKVWLKRIKETEDEVAIKNLIKKLYTKPIEHKPVYYQQVQAPHLLEISLFDHHFGMLAWGEETGTDYDLKIAEEVYINAVVGMLQRTKHYNFEKILIPLGNDFFHINSPDNLTPKGKNRLDVDTRLAKIIEVGERAVLKAIEQCRLVAPVEVLWVPGNHDPETSYYLAKIINAYYHNSDDVSVDFSPTVRKYYRYGSTLLGFTHGNEEPHNNLPTIMADERSTDWSETIYREWHLGHFHKKKEMQFTSVNSFGGTVVRILPSLSGTDYWHYKKGYVGRHRTAECLVFSRDEGPVGSFSVVS